MQRIITRHIGFSLIALVMILVALGHTLSGTAIAQTPAPIILFDDDFATYSHRWAESESPKASAYYTEETFTISIVSPGVNLWSVPDFTTPLYDYHLTVSAHIHNGGADAQFGVILDRTDDDQFYAWVIALDGSWYFLHHVDGVWHDLTPPDAILPDDVTAQFASGARESVRLQVDVTGDNTLTFTVNDHDLATIIVDETLTGSVFGVIARAEHGFIDVAFDDMLVTDHREMQ
ncbi:MAG: hypothetical protein JXA10_19810 [Anaerolineae bacterium]|nr:hypothetical protein [Anaerolineae bacterium]